MNIRDEVILKKFGNRLRDLRKERNISQQSLELKAGISKNQIGNIERGEVNVTLITLIAIASVLEISPKEFFDFS
ncbi:DNA-binding transcriptional regulator, XRE-family HTH domain [Daejeonella rubra]|uniref:DNA-binding transcriptional regulator, XRE-family HTH domain n=1 Tax=Daejeonella rubra TaxID=990371 RepID=A0A1G9S109_9SPHI|nr:helix-turn-helix transcriptional regulator [Daejeonella rubra]SDM29156.1 DNA-binding transcriptional regulator, XRE-family HTH domain [Daejeonella rubra]